MGQADDRSAVFFDLDRTLLRGASGPVISSALRRAGLMPDRSLPGEGTAANSKLWKLLTQFGGHEGVELDANSTDRLVTWMDTYAQRTGHFSEEQEAKLAAFRRECAPLLTEGNTR